MNKHFAVLLSGCGVFDGAEIQEAVLTLLAIMKNGCEYTVFAPDIHQRNVIDHSNNEELNEKRNVLKEAARISRGKIKSLDLFDAEYFDALIMPGGFGVAKNFSDYAISGKNIKVEKTVETAIKSMYNLQKPIGALCISPVVIASVIGDVELTLGNDDPSIEDVISMGASHMATIEGQIVIDQKNKVVTAPCYMLDSKITDIEIETGLVVKALIDLMN